MKVEYVILNQKLRYDDLRRYSVLLPAERQEKIARYRFERDKLLSLAAGLLIRRAIGETPLLFGEHGKPYTENGIQFSVSHSGRLATIAVDDSPVGLDVEKKPDESRLKIAGRFYHPGEQAYVADSVDKCRAFCEIWTRKEAYLKMTGEGISTDLSAFNTAAPPLSRQIITTVIKNYCLSVCADRPLKDKVVISRLELNDLLGSFSD